MTLADVTTFLLVLARMAGLAVAAPVFGHLLVPVRVRVALALGLTVAVAPVVAPASAAVPASAWTLAAALLLESSVGVMLGLIAQFIFAGAQLGGQIAGMQMGFGLVNLVDPQTQAHVTIVAQWQQLLALLLFLGLDIHHHLLAALIESFRLAPPGTMVVSAPGLRAIVSLAGGLFVVGMRIAAPILIALLLSSVTLGVLQRTVPQLNVFVLGFPVNVGLGLVMLGASLPFTYRLLASRFTELGPTLGGFIRGLAHG